MSEENNKEIDPSYKKLLEEEIERITSKPDWKDLYKGKFGNVLSDVYRTIKKRKKKDEEIISEEEFHRSIHEYAKDWPEGLREKAKPILEVCPKPPEEP